ncbi:MAG TPA: hypothetical protein VJY15_13705, partial [Candidatus Acidoferrum sp.]|nr:hypothetical protein [Candidatus Acidoferrum sp.]
KHSQRFNPEGNRNDGYARNVAPLSRSALGLPCADDRYRADYSGLGLQQLWSSPMAARLPKPQEQYPLQALTCSAKSRQGNCIAIVKAVFP